MPANKSHKKDSKSKSHKDSHKKDSKSKSSKTKKERKERIDPLEDITDMNYEDDKETTVTVITPIAFGPAPVQKTATKETGNSKRHGKDKHREAEGTIMELPISKSQLNMASVLDSASVTPHVSIKHDLRDAVRVEIGLGFKKGHHNEAQIEGAYCLIANKIPGGPVKLEKGKKYIFKFVGVPGSGYNLVITKDLFGGKDAIPLEGTTAIPSGKEGVIIFNQNAPSVLYYQDRDRPFLGGPIVFI